MSLSTVEVWGFEYESYGFGPEEEDAIGSWFGFLITVDFRVVGVLRIVWVLRKVN